MFEIGSKAFSRTALYIVIFSALLIYSTFFVKDLVFAVSYYPVAGNLCQWAQSNTNDCTNTVIRYNCSSGTYRPSFTCTATNQTCAAESASSSCGSCGDCNGAGSCISKTCITGNQYGCTSGNYCNSGGTCAATLANGQSCSSCSNGNFQCTSGNCANGGASVCCDSGYRCCSQNSDCLAGSACMSSDCKIGNLRWTSSSSSFNGLQTVLSATWIDNITLANATLATNETGAWQNKTGFYGSIMTLSGTSATTSFSWLNVSLQNGTVVAWQIFANNTLNQQNVTPILTFTVKSAINMSLNTTQVWWQDAVNASGFTQANAIITTYQGSNQLCSVTSLSSGFWNCTFIAPTGIGSYGIFANSSSAVTQTIVLDVFPFFGVKGIGNAPRVVYEVPFLIQDLNGTIQKIFIRVEVSK